MEVSIRIDDRDGRPTGSLYRWLAQDPELRPDTTVSIPAAPPATGEMGGAIDVINVVLSNGIAVGNLLVAVCAWRQSRPAPPATRIECGDVSVIIEDASPETVRQVVEALTDRPAGLGEDEGDGAI